MGSIYGRFSNKSTIPLYEDDSLEDLDEGAWKRQDWITFIGKNYGLALLGSPFMVTETLLQVQYRGNGAKPDPAKSEPSKPEAAEVDPEQLLSS